MTLHLDISCELKGNRYMKKLTSTLLFIALTSGCATQSFEIAGGNNSGDPDQEIMQPFLISGIGQTQEVNAAEICGGVENVAKVESYHSFLDGLLGTLTYGIFTPRQAKIYCTKSA